MKPAFRALLGLIAATLSPAAWAQATVTWSGNGADNNLATGGNWVGGVAPAPGDNVIFTLYPFQSVTVSAPITFGNIAFNGIQDGFYLNGGSNVLTLNGNVSTDTNSIYWGSFNLPVDLAAGNHVYTPTGGDLYHFGTVSGTGGITMNGSKTLIFAATNTYTGGTTINSGTVAVGADGALGTGTVTINGGTLSSAIYAYGPVTLANDFRFGANVQFGGFVNDGQGLYLGNNTSTIAPVSGVTAVNFTQTYSAPGILQFFGGMQDGVSGATRYTFSGSSPYYLSGTNTYTGGTYVTDGAEVFLYGPNSLPASGQIHATSGAYVGLSNTSISATTFAAALAPTDFHGTIGFDGNFTGNVSLGALASATAAIGTSTNATLNGVITPGLSGYHFRGSGQMIIQDATSTHPFTGTAGMIVESLANRAPIMVILSQGGTNDQTGLTQVTGAGLIYDATGSQSAGSSVQLNDGGYLGMSDTSGITPAAFVASFNSGTSYLSNSVLGFDSHSYLLNSTGSTTINNLDVSALVTPIYVGSASYATLTGTLTTTNNSSNDYYFTGYGGGTLQVDSALTGSRAVNIGLQNVFQDPTHGYAYSNVELTNAANTYSGGTYLHSGYLTVTDPAALGTGPIIVAPSGSDGTVALGIGGTVNNPITLSSGTLYVNYYSSAPTLAGTISGPGTLHVNSSVTLSGNNTYSGETILDNFSSIDVIGDHSLGTSELSTKGGTFIFHSAAPTIGSILDGAADDSDGTIYPELLLTSPGTSVLTINQSSDGYLDGAIIENGSVGSVIKSGAGTLTINGGTNGGTTPYSGGTTILQGKLVAGSANALGTGAITLNGGELGTALNIALTNAISFGANGGRLAGSGTFGAPINAGTNVVIAPGNSPGTLTFASGLTLSGGGALEFQVQYAGGDAGIDYDLVSISGGALVVASTPGAPFTIRLISLDAAGALGPVSDFSSSTGYTWMLFEANPTAGISGFSPANFTIDTTGFANPLNSGVFSLSSGFNGPNPALYLNFSPVPEPSTYALLAAGLGLVLLRRRRR